MKPFNLEEAKAGKQVCTRNGRKARIIATNIEHRDYPIAAVYVDQCGQEILSRYRENGRYLIDLNDLDLMMVEDEEPKCPFKPFDRVVVRDRNDDTTKWQCTFFSHYADDRIKHKFVCVDSFYAQCVPYNEETEHLIGTTDDAPEKYVIWKTP